MQAAWTQQANELFRNGSINAEEFFNLAMTDEEGGAEQLKILLGYTQRLPRPQQDPVWHELAAKHLPELVTKFRADDSGALTQTARIINTISYTPYFVRFVSTPAARSPSIAAVYTHRVFQHSQVLSASPSPDDVAEACQFLATLLLVQGVDDIDPADKNGLLPILRQWIRRPAFRGRLASEASERVVWLLTGDRSMAQPLSMVRGQLLAPLEKCSVSGCNKTRANDSLMQCSRCKSALFCNRDHQKAAWREHKKICFEAVF